MMDYENRKSLVTKIIEKGVITPYEAVHLQYLNHKHCREQIRSLDMAGNYYLSAENIPELYSPSLLKQMLTFRSEPDGRLYEAYQWVANDLANHEAHIGEIGYKGLALLNEIRYMRSENSLRVVLDMKLKGPLVPDIFEYQTYSRVAQKRVTFSEILGSFGSTFRILMIDIDNVLTENYYLQNLFDLEDLECLKYLKMWLGQEGQEEDLDEEEPMTPFLNLTQACCKNSLGVILDDNHPKLVELIKAKINSFGIDLPASFEKGSRDFVEETIARISEPTSNLQKVD